MLVLPIFMTIENDEERSLAEHLYLTYKSRMYGIASAVYLTAEARECGFGRDFFTIRAGDDIVKFLVPYLCPAGDCTVDHGFQLCVDRIKVYRACKHRHIGINHFLKDLCHIVLDRAGSGMVAAIADLFLCDADCFHLIAGIPGTACKFLAKDVRVSALARTAGYNQYFFRLLSPLFLLFQYRTVAECRSDSLSHREISAACRVIGQRIELIKVDRPVCQN